ncbi:hypothetical protein [Prochlorothrix hollandica]|uniref:hypothetical protein n=1 Tax=Prochlorothrix hollandica TaxID=1223 RepID=UPI003340EA2D
MGKHAADRVHGFSNPNGLALLRRQHRNGGDDRPQGFTTLRYVLRIYGSLKAIPLGGMLG